MANFDLKSFMINEGLTRVSRDRKKLVESIGYGYGDDFDEFEDHEIDQELLSALEAHSDAEGYGSLNGYSWFYNQGDPIIDTVNGQSFKLSNATEDEEMDLWSEIEKAGWVLSEGEEPDEPYDPKKDSKRQEEERAKRIHREGMPENTPRQDGLNKNGGHKNNRR